MWRLISSSFFLLDSLSRHDKVVLVNPWDRNCRTRTYTPLPLGFGSFWYWWTNCGRFWGAQVPHVLHVHVSQICVVSLSVFLCSPYCSRNRFQTRDMRSWQAFRRSWIISGFCTEGLPGDALLLQIVHKAACSVDMAGRRQCSMTHRCRSSSVKLETTILKHLSILFKNTKLV